MEIMLTRQDADFILEHAESNTAKYKYEATIRWLFDEEKAESVSASMFKGEMRNPDYTPIEQKVMKKKTIGSGTASFLIRDESLKTWDGEFWSYLENEGFHSWGKHGNWGCEWVYVNVNSKLYAPGMPGIPITQCVISKNPRSALSLNEFKQIWEILKRHEKTEVRDEALVYRGLKMFVRCSSKVNCKKMIEFLESDGFKCENNSSFSRNRIIESGLPLVIDFGKKTIRHMGNVTCAAAAAGSGAIKSEKEFYLIYSTLTKK